VPSLKYEFVNTLKLSQRYENNVSWLSRLPGMMNYLNLGACLFIHNQD